MFIDVVVAVCVAFTACGIVFALFHLIRVQRPRWLMPVVAAVAIIGVTAHLRYDWQDRTAALLPERMVVVEKMTSSTFLEPWSLVQPVVTGLVAVDTVTVKRNAAHPDMLMVDLVVLRRADDTVVVPHMVDCAGRRVAPLPAAPTFGSDGLPMDLSWRSGAPESLFTAACNTAV
ncbi:hypothetical protein [Telmatospirillum sp. J64-1]|uniref:hypothetical protein n=1 Tax=Telmatospirillum sp. J64-1 TaxID=2502183 RepID=UPI00115E0C65|nr:hypothetical protein [Telmatospirillum sp. J64-1]